MPFDNGQECRCPSCLKVVIQQRIASYVQTITPETAASSIAPRFANNSPLVDGIDYRFNPQEINDVPALTQAFTGVEGAFVLLPSSFIPAPGFPEVRRLAAGLRTCHVGIPDSGSSSSERSSVRWKERGVGGTGSAVCSITATAPLRE